MSSTPPAAKPPPKRRRGAWIALGVAGALVAAVAACEWQGWPFLARPAERWLSTRLQRDVSFEETDASSLRLHLLGGIQLSAGRVRVANPAWSSLGPMLDATDATLKLRYRDLLAFRKGQELNVDVLRADTLALAVERRPDGRASWQFGEPKAAGQKPAFSGVRFGEVAVRQGSASVNDALLRLDAKAEFALTDAGIVGSPAAPASTSTTSAASAASAPSANAAAPRGGLTASAEGKYRDLPLHATLRSGSALGWLESGPQQSKLPMQLRVQVGRARLAFDGRASDLFGKLAMDGRYDVSGPSLDAVGEPLGLTLPTTRAFAMQGHADRNGNRWHTVVDSATVGRSRLAGEFTFDNPPGAVPALAGKLRGPLLWLADLGPAVGVPTPDQPAPAQPRDRVLPVREFDLPSLRRMNADVAIAIDRLESGSPRLQAVQPLLAHLRLADGVLDIDDLDARLAQGQLRGHIRLDGRQPVALWEAHLTGTGLQLEQWVLQPRPDNLPPYATGRLGAQVDIRGRGRSTAELLASADGRAVVHWTQGTISHVAVEAAGIDIAQALGVMIRGDKALPVTCGAADLAIKDGRVTPKVMLIDTSDSTIWVDGSMSLATEQMQFVARVDPKDFSPLALRTPIHVDGSLNAPRLSLEKGPLARKVVPAVLLAMINPLAAILPLIDTGDDEAKKAVSACQAVTTARRG